MDDDFRRGYRFGCGLLAARAVTACGCLAVVLLIYAVLGGTALFFHYHPDSLPDFLKSDSEKTKKP